MRINADFTQRAVVLPADYQWVESPMPGVERMMLDRVGDEVARATSIVRYAPDSRFSPHVHGGGEEFFVLEGTFGDEHRSYPAGTYVRNPIGTQHAPRVGADGCIIFVKLHQFDERDDRSVVLDTNQANWQRDKFTGIEAQLLHTFGSEKVALVKVPPNTRVAEHTHRGGEEAFVIDGCVCDEHGEYPKGSWVRNPAGSRHSPFTTDLGAVFLVKSGHLSDIT